MKTIKIVLQSTEYPDIEISTLSTGEIRIKQEDDTVLLQSEHLKAFIDALMCVALPQLFLE